MSDDGSSEGEQGREYQRGLDRDRARRNPYYGSSSEEEEAKEDPGSEGRKGPKKPIGSEDEQIAKVDRYTLRCLITQDVCRTRADHDCPGRP